MRIRPARVYLKEAVKDPVSDLRYRLKKFRVLAAKITAASALVDTMRQDYEFWLDSLVEIIKNPSFDMQIQRQVQGTSLENSYKEIKDMLILADSKNQSFWELLDTLGLKFLNTDSLIKEFNKNGGSEE